MTVKNVGDRVAGAFRILVKLRGQFTDLNWQHRYKVALTREE